MRTDAHLGGSVASAGDVNGDRYDSSRRERASDLSRDRPVREAKALDEADWTRVQAGKSARPRTFRPRKIIDR